MKSSARKIQVSGFNDLFQAGTDAGPDDERIQEVPLTELHPFKDHPFRVRDDEAMQKTAEHRPERRPVPRHRPATARGRL